jgi:hypothetical protein
MDVPVTTTSQQKRAAKRQARKRRKLVRVPKLEMTRRQRYQSVSILEDGARACPDCGLTSMHCDQCNQGYRFLCNVECMHCGARNHVFETSQKVSYLECTCGAVQEVKVDVKGDIVSVASLPIWVDGSGQELRLLSQSSPFSPHGSTDDGNSERSAWSYSRLQKARSSFFVSRRPLVGQQCRLLEHGLRCFLLRVRWVLVFA